MNEHLRDRRVRLIKTNDKYTELRPGTIGTIQFTDDLGTVHIKWDSGELLGLIPNVDEWELLPTVEECQIQGHNFQSIGTIDEERDFYGLKYLVEYECTDCEKVIQEWQREK